MRTRTRTHIRTRAVAAALAAATFLALTACEGTDTSSGTNTSDTKQSSKARTDSDSDEAAKADTAVLPDLRGKVLQTAQDEAQAAGFRYLTSHDALGRGRVQALDRNWKVCSQAPVAGGQPTDTKVDFGAVKLRETCPAEDADAVPEAGATMPDFKGKSVKVAREALDSGTAITVTDASPDDRMVLVESNWQVCTQDPAAGSDLDGLPVTITAVKFGETC
ncbi:hypothetical protein ACH4TV_16385 [Streptomyces sp. NPDC020898]|uniref:hypothetical protein n=1 Tax=Streptomyces sp. NPDC020898 TaxID=3365101 RepID=UPI003788DAF0